MSTLNCRARHHSGWLSQRRPIELWPYQCRRLSNPLQQGLAVPTPNERTEATAAPSPVILASTVAG
jgi:hypothetical protein